MRRIVTAEASAGRLRRDADPDLAAALILGTLGQVVRMAHFAELPHPAATLADPLHDLLLRGLGA